jgi:hypothetical protein
MTRRTLAWVAIDLDPLIAEVIEERSEEEGVGPAGDQEERRRRVCTGITRTGTPGDHHTHLWERSLMTRQAAGRP